MGELQAQTKGDRAKMLPVPSVRLLFPYLQRTQPKFKLPPVRKPSPQEEGLHLEPLLFPLQDRRQVLLGMLLVTYLVLANLQRSWGADNILNKLAQELCADALLVSEQSWDRDPSIWIPDSLSTAAFWTRNSQEVMVRSHGRGRGLDVGM
ncbi:hypothetical protein J6590_070832 [Homalodisca vitripennis]|nr:hypothetical protein J6590_093657 [Homalodisca vitripennis]KAG8276180.1 hypothetical protein J6590_070832 [Homalodisca vitripennis]